ncbi:MAG: zf-HC2 domain-containing protein, partial [Polyangiaceae bacterium]|nr:zf-HC2 domain-containing protein [Polyangiaceae bacterium]
MASNQTNFEPLCDVAHDRLADLLDGTAPVELVDHLASCDRCRDLRHDASRLASLVSAAGDDYVAPNDLEARLFAALEGRPAPAFAPEVGASMASTHDTHVSAHPPVPPAAPFGATYPSSPGGPRSGIVSSGTVAQPYPTGANQTGSPAVSAVPNTPMGSTANAPAYPARPASAAKPQGTARQRALRAWAREYRLPFVGLVASLAVAAVALFFVRQRQGASSGGLARGA